MFTKKIVRKFYHLGQGALQKGRATVFGPSPRIMKPTTYPKFKNLNKGEKTYNLFLPSIDKKSIFGGIYTALLFLKEIQNTGARIHITSFNTEIDNKSQVLQFLKEKLDLELKNSQIQTYSDFLKTTPGENEIFIATIWYTANEIRKILAQNSFVQKKFIYLIQDFEPGFYNWSDDFAGAMSSYRKNDFYPIFNSTLLKDYFVEKNILPSKDYFVVHPQIEVDQLKPSKNPRRDQRKKLLLYARPGTPRNLFETALQAIVDWLEEDKPEIILHSAGESHVDVCYKHWRLQSLGKMDVHKYWENLSTYDIGLSLMLSPHPSYPPLEMAKSGVITVTNKFENKDLSLFSKNIISCEPTVENIKEGLSEAYKRADNHEDRIKNSEFIIDSEGESLQKVTNSLLEFF